METFIKVLGGIVAVLIIAVLLSFPVMWLWNGLMPEIFGLVRISIWQALGLSVLSSLLFKSTN